MKIRARNITVVAVIALVGILTGASGLGDRCTPVPPAPCYSVDTCGLRHCLGPEMVNPATGPATCDGDFVVEATGLYWSSSEDGLEYAIQTFVQGSTATGLNPELNNLVRSTYFKPTSHWDFGLKLGAFYNSTFDGWDFGLRWTHFKNSSIDQVENNPNDNVSLLPLWSSFQFPSAGNAPNLFVSGAKTNWKLQLNLIDIELGREMWMSKYLAFRPYIGLRVAYIDQDFAIEYRGGSFTDAGVNLNFNDWVKLENDFRSVGLRSGFNTTWNFGRGWAFFGNIATSLLTGRFSLSHKESLIRATGPFNGQKILSTSESFRADRASFDYSLGIQWATFFSECRYGFTLFLGWEEQIFFSQNQLWRVTRVGGTNETNTPNTTGQNIFHQRRGDLSTQGVSLTAKLAF